MSSAGHDRVVPSPRDKGWAGNARAGFRAPDTKKLVVQIPCFNEERTLPGVISGIPRRIPGIADVEVLVIDDGSTDCTLEVAHACGADHVICNHVNRGLAASFQAGIERALDLGADIIVNTDGDHQYDSASIPDLVRPILEGRADIVIGDRNPAGNPGFSPIKRLLQRFGSSAVSALSGVAVSDAVSGFRAYSREAALRINVMTNFSYTIETLVHAGQAGLVIRSVPVLTNRTTRPSRLFRSTTHFLRRQLVTILRSLVMYRSLSAFLFVGVVMLAIGIAPILRFIYLYAIGEGDGHVQSLVLGGVLLLAGYLTVIIAFLSDAVATNRRLTEAILLRLRRAETGLAATEPTEIDGPTIPGQSAEMTRVRGRG